MLKINDKFYKNEEIKKSYGINHQNGMTMKVLDLSVVVEDNSIKKKYYFESLVNIDKLNLMLINETYHQHGITDFLYFENDTCITYEPEVDDPFKLIDSFEDINVFITKLTNQKFNFIIKISKCDFLLQVENLIIDI